MTLKTFAGRFANLARIRKLVGEAARRAGFSDAEVYDVILAVDEACSNIIDHAYGGEGHGDIECACEILDHSLQVTLHDWGESFDSERVPDPECDVPLEELRLRGAGLALMRRLMDEIRFESSSGNGNTLTMLKHADHAPHDS